MKKPSVITFKIFQIIILLSMVGCTVQTSAAPTADPQIFSSTVSAAKTQAVEAVIVQLTQSAVPTQTLTDIPLPTQTPSLTPTPIPEFTQTSTAVPTRAATAVPTQGEYQCSITAIEPKYGSAMASGADFDLIVTVKNTGTEKWVKDNIDFKYLSGVTLQKKADAIDLPANVDPGDSIELRVDMTARSESGAQAAVWGLVRSSTAFCTVGINIVVQ